MSSRQVKEYLSHHHISQLLESLLTGLLFHRPEDPLRFLQDALKRTRTLGGPEAVSWDTFIHHLTSEHRTPPPPPSKPAGAPPEPTGAPREPTGPPSKPTGAPPEPAGLSIESDSDMTESSGLLQEVNILPSQRPHPLIIFIIGGPGSGKGSQTTKLTAHFGFRGLSLDELLRRQLLTDSTPGRRWELMSELMSHGELGTQEDTVSELRQQLIGQQEVGGVIVDGFPRDIHQALSFQEQVGSPDLVLMLVCSNEMLRGRLQRRAARLGLLGDGDHTLQRRLDRFQRDIVSISRYYRQLTCRPPVDDLLTCRPPVDSPLDHL
uniref:Nucleoside-diphosphate kinase n=1 Tax=Amphiprion ocellaris TaxID=80972 RepID=A0AAQ5ZTM8_AMPOC